MKLPGGDVYLEPLEVGSGRGPETLRLTLQVFSVRAHLARGSARVAAEEQSAVPEPCAPPRAVGPCRVCDVDVRRAHTRRCVWIGARESFITDVTKVPPL